MSCILLVCLDQEANPNSRRAFVELVQEHQLTPYVVMLAGLSESAVEDISHQLRHYLYNAQDFLRYDATLWHELPSFQDVWFVKAGQITRFRQVLSHSAALPIGYQATSNVLMPQA